MRRILAALLGLAMMATACGAQEGSDLPPPSIAASDDTLSPVPTAPPATLPEPRAATPAAPPVTLAETRAPATTTTAAAAAEALEHQPPASGVPVEEETNLAGDGGTIACADDGSWPSEVASPDILVRWTGTDWEFEGRTRLESARTQVAFEYFRGSPSGVYIALVGLTGGRTPADFLEIASDQELGRYHVRLGEGGSRWEVPEWVSFVGSVEHGCGNDRAPGAAHRAVYSYFLPAGRYVILGHPRFAAGVGSLATADLIAGFDVVRLAVKAQGSMIRLTACHDPRCLEETVTHITAMSDCAHRVELALGPEGRPRMAYLAQPDGDPLCDENLPEWTGAVQLIECLDPVCTEHTERTLAVVDYLWAGPYGLDVQDDGTIVTSWYVASSGHPVSEVVLQSATCGHDQCDVIDIETSRPWNIDYEQ